MAGNVNSDIPEGTQSLLLITPVFHSLIDSLTKLRDLSNAIKDYFKIAEENEHKITVLDINRLNDAANRPFDLANHLKQLKASAGNFSAQLIALKDYLFSGEVADLTKRIDEFHKLADRIKPIYDSVYMIACKNYERPLKKI